MTAPACTSRITQTCGTAHGAPSCSTSQSRTSLSFLRSALDFWITVYHFDGIRYDAVSNLIYQGGSKDKGLNEPGLWFLRSTNFTLQQDHPEVMLIAEDSSDYLKVTAPVAYGGLGFDYKWNLGWMHDTLDYLATPFTERAGMKNRFLFSMSYFYQENYILPLSHDEVVHGKKTIIDKLWGSYEQKFAQLRCLYCYMLFHPGKKLSFMGNELAEFMEWSEERQPGWNLLDYPVHRSFHVFLQRLNTLYCTAPPCGSRILTAATFSGWTWEMFSPKSLPSSGGTAAGRNWFCCSISPTGTARTIRFLTAFPPSPLPIACCWTASRSRRWTRSRFLPTAFPFPG